MRLVASGKKKKRRHSQGLGGGYWIEVRNGHERGAQGQISEKPIQVKPGVLAGERSQREWVEEEYLYFQVRELCLRLNFT